MQARVVDCSDHDAQYGILTVDDVGLKEVQNKIYEIKRKFSDEGFDDWCIDDMLNEFPEEWKWNFDSYQADDTVEI